jgi:hypothetical protein
VYESAINPDKLEMKIKEGERLFQTQEYAVVPDAEFVTRRELMKFGFDRDTTTNEMKRRFRSNCYAISIRITSRIPSSLRPAATERPHPNSHAKREQLEAVKRWFYHDWRRIEPKLRTSIVEGISVFLSLFDDNPSVKATFCPPKECY